MEKSNILSGHLCYKVAKTLAELCPHPSVLWKVKLASDEIRHLDEEISKQSVEEVTWFLLTACSKMREMELLNKKEAEHKDVKKISAYPCCKE